MSFVANDHDGHDPIVPGWALGLAGCAIAASILAAAIGNRTATAPAAAILATRTLDFADAPDGAVLVHDAVTHRMVARLAPGTNGFVRAALRAMAHEGGHEASPRPAHPFRLTARSDGRLVLYDPATATRLDLEAFGSINERAFAALLTAEESP